MRLRLLKFIELRDKEIENLATAEMQAAMSPPGHPSHLIVKLHRQIVANYDAAVGELVVRLSELLSPH